MKESAESWIYGLLSTGDEADLLVPFVQSIRDMARKRRRVGLT